MGLANQYKAKDKQYAMWWTGDTWWYRCVQTRAALNLYPTLSFSSECVCVVLFSDRTEKKST